MEIFIALILFLIAISLFRAVFSRIQKLRAGYYPCHICGKWTHRDFLRIVIELPKKKKFRIICHKCRFELDRDGLLNEIDIDEIET